MPQIRYNPLALGFAMALPTAGVGIIAYLLLKDGIERNLSAQSVLIGVPLLLFFAFFSINVLNGSSVKFETDGISKRSFFVRKQLLFSEIVKVEKERLAGVLWKILLLSDKERIVINVFFYRESDKLIDLIKTKL